MALQQYDTAVCFMSFAIFQSLKSLLHDHYAFRADTNLNVWVHPGHVIVSHGQTGT